MAYTPNYTEDDIAGAGISTITKAILSVGSVIVLIVFVSLYIWAKKKMK